jgi:hypothetical protein
MNKHCDQFDIERRQQNFNRERFRWHFQRRLREYLARHGSVAEGFGPVWERILQEVPVEEAEQAELYWELIQWARGYELFTGAVEPRAVVPEQNRAG